MENIIKYETRKVAELTNWKDNPRTIDKKEMERLKKQIQKLGVYKTLIVNQQNIVLGGNMRLVALKSLGIDEVMCSIVATDNTAQMLEYALSDNDQAGLTDEEKVAELVMLHQIDTELFAINSSPMKLVSSLINEISPETQEDEPPKIDDTPAVSKLGEVYQVGPHRLMCGDATSSDDAKKLMGGVRADIAFTSPPYNVGHNLGYDNDNKYNEYDDDNEQYYELLSAFHNNALEHSVYSFVNLQFLAGNKKQIIQYLFSSVDQFCDIAYWKKTQVAPAMANNVMNSQVECIFIFGGNGSRAIATGNFRGTVSNILETAHAGHENENAGVHAATFPVAFVGHFIKNFTKKGMKVLDLFGGTGTTMIAADQLDRICYMMELDPKYCDIVRKRYANHVGKPDQWQELTKAI